ncbi:MAG: protein kinase [Myxococcales bacterium]
MRDTLRPPPPSMPLPSNATTQRIPAVTLSSAGSSPASWSGASARPAPEPSGAWSPPPFPQPGSFLQSTRGVYEVCKVIGGGEFGAVFECVGPFDQAYALKMIRPANRPYQEVYTEWAREVQRLMSLRHPNVVYIYDAFEQYHLFFLALERCEHSLADMLDRPMQEPLVLELSRQLLAAVQFLHDNDVVHDDLHAGNVLIVSKVDRPVVKISDFGISHELRGAPAVRPKVVHHTIMAPEIAASGYTTKQSDLYQVGLLLYRMLTGESAVPADIAYDDLLRYVAEGEPRRRAETICTPLGFLIAKLLRRREQYRYTSAREVWTDLRELPTWKRRDPNLFPIR